MCKECYLLRTLERFVKCARDKNWEISLNEMETFIRSSLDDKYNSYISIVNTDTNKIIENARSEPLNNTMKDLRKALEMD